MGCGKSSIGKRLAAMLGCPIADLDKLIVAAQRRSIPEIFESDGESAFRRMELSALREVLAAATAAQPCPASQVLAAAQPGAQSTSLPICSLILSLGGGTLTTPDCADLVREKTVCIYLRATVDTLASNLDHDNGKRPMLYSSDTPLRERIEELMAERSFIYEMTAHHIIDIDGKSDSIITRDILRALTGEE